jgi:hypothetical protein
MRAAMNSAKGAVRGLCPPQADRPSQFIAVGLDLHDGFTGASQVWKGSVMCRPVRENIDTQKEPTFVCRNTVPVPHNEFVFRDMSKRL